MNVEKSESYDAEKAPVDPVYQPNLSIDGQPQLKRE
jgi:hypothetical protein